MAIDRAALVARHRITLTQPDAMSPLSVGNGEFAFTADITGLQTFPEFHTQGLETAQRWRERLGLERDPEWERVKNGLAAPQPCNGVYPAIETAPYTIRNDHPSMLMALGFVPPTPLIDPQIMR